MSEELMNEVRRLRDALTQIEGACNLSPCRDVCWDENLARLIHHHARFLPPPAATPQESPNG